MIVLRSVLLLSLALPAAAPAAATAMPASAVTTPHSLAGTSPRPAQEPAVRTVRLEIEPVATMVPPPGEPWQAKMVRSCVRIGARVSC